MDYCYVEFEAKNIKDLERLTNIFEVIKDDKDKEVHDIDNKWIKLFSDIELDEFWWPNEEQYEQTREMFGDVFIKVRSNTDNEREDWDIYSMFDAIMNGEYELIGIRSVSSAIYRLEFNPFGYPYGGTGSLRKLINCLGHRIVAFDDGTGRLIVNKDGVFEYE